MPTTKVNLSDNGLLAFYRSVKPPTVGSSELTFLASEGATGFIKRQLGVFESDLDCVPGAPERDTGPVVSQIVKDPLVRRVMEQQAEYTHTKLDALLVQHRQENREVRATKALLGPSFSVEADPAAPNRALLGLAKSRYLGGAGGNFELDADDGPSQEIKLGKDAVLTKIKNMVSGTPFNLLVTLNGYKFRLEERVFYSDVTEYEGEYVALSMLQFPTGIVALGRAWDTPSSWRDRQEETVDDDEQPTDPGPSGPSDPGTTIEVSELQVNTPNISLQQSSSRIFLKAVQSTGGYKPVSYEKIYGPVWLEVELDGTIMLDKVRDYGTYLYGVRAVDLQGFSDTASASITVSVDPTVTFGATAHREQVPSGQIRTFSRGTYHVFGGETPYRFARHSGPSWIQILQDGQTIFTAPTVAADRVFDFEVEIMDSDVAGFGVGDNRIIISAQVLVTA